jgi:hypothetical protein
MKHNGIIALVFVIGCATGGVAAQLVVPPVRAGTSPTRWEYQCVDSERDALTSTLNRFGAEGWELASFAPARTGGSISHDISAFMLCTKRALP